MRMIADSMEGKIDMKLTIKDNKLKNVITYL